MFQLDYGLFNSPTLGSSPPFFSLDFQRNEERDPSPVLNLNNSKAEWNGMNE